MKNYGWEKRKGNSSSFLAAHSYLVVMCERHFNISKSYFRHNSQTEQEEVENKETRPETMCWRWIRREWKVKNEMQNDEKVRNIHPFGMSQQVSYFARIFQDSFLKNINILLMQHKLLANKKSKWFSRGVENNINRMMENIFSRVKNNIQFYGNMSLLMFCFSLSWRIVERLQAGKVFNLY